MTSNAPNTYIYNAENQLAWTNSSPSYRYVYDGNGRRVEKCTAASVTTACPTSGTTGTLYWHNLGGDTLYESDLAGNPQEEYIYFNGLRVARRDVTSSGGTIAMHYYFSDHLGTHSIVTDANGDMPPQEESDFYPYGGEIPLTTGDSNHYKFTGKERDSESGLDYFGARFHASTMGRLITPDPDQGSGSEFMDDPQSWNGYSYGRNNPLAVVDPDGRMYEICSLHASTDDDTLVQHCSMMLDPMFEKEANAAQGFGEVFDHGLMYHSDKNGSTILDGTYRWLGPDPQVSNGAVIPLGLGPGDFLLGGWPFGGLARSAAEGAAEASGEGVLQKMTIAERSMKAELEAAGNTVERIPASKVPGVKTADWLVNGVKQEFKEVTGSAPTSIKNAIQRAAKQSDEQILIDARPSGLGAEAALNQIMRAQGNIGGLEGRVTVLTKDGVVKF